MISDLLLLWTFTRLTPCSRYGRKLEHLGVPSEVMNAEYVSLGSFISSLPWKQRWLNSELPGSESQQGLWKVSSRFSESCCPWVLLGMMNLERRGIQKFYPPPHSSRSSTSLVSCCFNLIKENLRGRKEKTRVWGGVVSWDAYWTISFICI